MAVAPTARAAVEGAEVVVCMLSSGQVCDAVLLGPEGAVAAMAPGATLVVMSSIPVETARAQAAACAERGLAYVDAPVSGGERGAKDGTLAIMAGGDAASSRRWPRSSHRLADRPTSDRSARVSSRSSRTS